MFALPKGKAVLIASVLLALAFALFGGMKFMSPQELLDNFARWGYPQGSHYLVGALELAGAIGLFIRPLARYAALGLGLLMMGAVGTHILNPPLADGIPSFILGALAFFVAWRYFRSNSQ